MAGNLLPEWEMQGFAAPPEPFVSTGSEVLVRAFNPDAPANRAAATAHAARAPGLSDGERRKLAMGFGHGTSGILSNCFFVPAFNQTSGPIMPRVIDTSGWDGAFLEDNLSAFIFGNDYAALAFYRMPEGIPYSIGTVARYPRYVSNGRIEHWAPKGKTRPNSPILRQIVLRPGSANQLALLHKVFVQRIMGLGPISPKLH